MNKTLPYEEAAEKRTGIEGWVCKSCRRFFGDEEHLARYCCAKDMPCDTARCKGRKESGYGVCEPCRETFKLARWKALPEIPWDGKTPLCLDDDDKYFFDDGALLDYLEEHALKIEDVRLVICEERGKPTFDMLEFLDDCVLEGMELEAEWGEIDKIVNAWIEKNVPVVWEPSRVRPTHDSLPKEVKA